MNGTASLRRVILLVLVQRVRAHATFPSLASWRDSFPAEDKNAAAMTAPAAPNAFRADRGYLPVTDGAKRLVDRV